MPRGEKGAWHLFWSDFGFRSAEGFRRVQKGGDGNSRAQIVIKGRRGVGMLIKGRRWFFKGAEEWGCQVKGAYVFLKAQRGGDAN